MYAQDTSEAVRVLKRASKTRESPDWEASQRLFEAARKAVETCKGDMANVCMDAFYEKDEGPKP